MTQMSTGIYCDCKSTDKDRKLAQWHMMDHHWTNYIHMLSISEYPAQHMYSLWIYTFCCDINEVTCVSWSHHETENNVNNNNNVTSFIMTLQQMRGAASCWMWSLVVCVCSLWLLQVMVKCQNRPRSLPQIPVKRLKCFFKSCDCVGAGED